jgi:hypothetical protein
VFICKSWRVNLRENGHFNYMTILSHSFKKFITFNSMILWVRHDKLNFLTSSSNAPTSNNSSSLLTTMVGILHLLESSFNSHTLLNRKFYTHLKRSTRRVARSYEKNQFSTSKLILFDFFVFSHCLLVAFFESSHSSVHFINSHNRMFRFTIFQLYVQ